MADTPDVAAAKNGRLAAATLRALLKHAKQPLPSKHRKHIHGRKITTDELTRLDNRYLRNLEKVERSMVDYARTAAHFANIFLDPAPELCMPSRPAKQFRTIHIP